MNNYVCSDNTKIIGKGRPTFQGDNCKPYNTTRSTVRVLAQSTKECVHLATYNAAQLAYTSQSQAACQATASGQVHSCCIHHQFLNFTKTTLWWKLWWEQKPFLVSKTHWMNIFIYSFCQFPVTERSILMHSLIQLFYTYLLEPSGTEDIKLYQKQVNWGHLEFESRLWIWLNLSVVLASTNWAIRVSYWIYSPCSVPSISPCSSSRSSHKHPSPCLL